MTRPESVFELLEDPEVIKLEFNDVPESLKIGNDKSSISQGLGCANGQAFAASGNNRGGGSGTTDESATLRIEVERLQEPLSFANHIRNRASALVNLLPFAHRYQNVLSAIANIDWQTENESPTVEDSRTYLWLAGVSSDKTAIAYLDWLEPRLRRALTCYEQMVNCHRHEVDRFVHNFDAAKY